MTDPKDSDLMDNFTRMFGGGNPAVLDTAMEIPDVLIELGGLLGDHDNIVDQAVADDDALAIWGEASPEARSAILLNLAWQTRTTDLPDGVDLSTGGNYAIALHTYAKTFTGDDLAFHGNGFPALPLPGQAGALASSLAFDREDLPISLETALLFLSMVAASEAPTG